MPIHKQRDSLDGFNRKRLRGTLRAKLGVKPNSAMFESRGQSWHTTEPEQRQEAQRRQVLERHLREANFSETRFIDTLLDKLADAGPPEPVKVDKQELAAQAKPKPPARTKPDGKFIALSQKVRRFAALQRELDADSRVAAKTTDKYRDYGHFVLERD